MSSFALEFARQDKYLRAAVSVAEHASNSHTDYLTAIANHFELHDCECLLLENHLTTPFAIWEAAVIAPRLARHFDGCIKFAIVEMNGTPAGQMELKIHLSSEKELTIRIFWTTAEAEAWFNESAG